MARIKIFIRLTILTGQLTSLHYSYDYHYYMEKYFRGNYHWLRDQGFSKGRIFDPGCAPLLPIIDKLMNQSKDQVRIFDLNTIKGKWMGMRSLVWSSPVVLIDSQKFSGLEACQQGLSSLIQPEPFAE